MKIPSRAGASTLSVSGLPSGAVASSVTVPCTHRLSVAQDGQVRQDSSLRPTDELRVLHVQLHLGREERQARRGRAMGGSLSLWGSRLAVPVSIATLEWCFSFTAAAETHAQQGSN